MNKASILIMIVGLVLLSVFVSGAQQEKTVTTVLPDLVRPRYMAVDSQRVYIVNNFLNVTGYSVRDFKENFEIKARKGHGPAEFVNVPMIVSYGENTILKTTEKIAYYTGNGKYLSEKKLKREGVIHPLDDNYLFWYFGYSKTDRSLFTIIDILDKNQVRIKNIYKYKAPPMNMIVSGGDGSRKGKLDLIREHIAIDVWKDKVFIADQSRGFYILVCDKAGNTVREIVLNEPKVKITDKDRELLITKKKVDWGNDERWKDILRTNELYCPEFFPSFERIAVANEKIYVKTFQTREDMMLFIILDFQGKEHARVYLPQSEYWAIYDNRYYFLTYSDDDDEWSLNRVTIQG